MTDIKTDLQIINNDDLTKQLSDGLQIGSLPEKCKSYTGCFRALYNTSGGLSGDHLEHTM
jgi:hypothetical protein